MRHEPHVENKLSYCDI